MNKVFFLIASLFLFGCASQFPAPVDGERKKISKECPDIYTVKKDETLFSISLKCGFNYKEVALSNGLKKPYFVKIGDRIRLDILRKSKVNSIEEQNDNEETKIMPYSEEKITEDNVFINENEEQGLNIEFQYGEPLKISEPKVIREVYSRKSIKKSKKLADLKDKNKKNWDWPTDGELSSSFNQASDKKGIEILGLEGQEIRSVTKGKVIYVGEDLAGYGKLTIIKHDNNILSVYGHQQATLVSEGQTVQAGQSIGTMGKTGADEVKLLFEIRRNGESIDPVNFLKDIS
ncbi:peptidoglycan DD-metalloendopeptidase family protein [Methylophilaceae bacterium]|nr:peptidoglycan DD-metalloendopeptidase family protein [Methylophilaceae bacterium]|tara:strand:+ start:1642 stop:2511 length:870 start_codon:yes stop_codon:yes gene_type:complete